MIGNSRVIDSSQQGPDDRLLQLISRYQASRYSRPIAQHTRDAVDWLTDTVDLTARRLVLDTGCGTGESTHTLAQRLAGDQAGAAEPLFIGVDQSAARLRSDQWQAPGVVDGSVILLRADLADFWRLLAERQIKLWKHYFLYPNPWPKASQLQRRWHAHPAFGSALSLGGDIELRTNWAAFAEEFAAALRAYHCGDARAVKITPERPISPFEKKYLASGHWLYGVRHQLTPEGNQSGA